MSATNARLRFYAFGDLTSATVDYAPPLSDYPEFPREESVDIFKKTFKSAIGSNYWIYRMGTAASWRLNWEEVSDDCVATMASIAVNFEALAPHVVIWEAQGVDTVDFASLCASIAPKGTYFIENELWNPQEVKFGLWNFSLTFRKEA